jgi:plastocyanin
MPAAVWSITIKPGATAGAPATFDPPNLKASAGDVVSWNNTTRELHQIWQLVDAQGHFLPMPIGASGRWEPIAPGGQSPAWTVPKPGGQTIYYGCVLHFTADSNKVPISTEIGTITT